MPDKDKTETQTSLSSDIQTDTSVGVSLSPTGKPELMSQQEEKNPKTKTHYGEYVIWFLIAVAFVVLPSWRVTREFLDTHSGAVAAIGTLGIMLLTIAYVRYSGHQWKAMDGQLRQMEKQVTEMQIGREQTIEQMTAAGIQTNDLIEQARAQVTALGTLADATKRNADAFVNIERAWIFLDITLIGSVVTKTEYGSRIEIDFRCRNVGKTPAWITQKIVDFHIFPPGTSIAIDFNTLGPFEAGAQTIEAGQDQVSRQIMETQGRPGNLRFTRVLGIVKYRDIFGKDRMTVRGYMLSPNEKTLDPIIAPEFNQYT